MTSEHTIAAEETKDYRTGGLRPGLTPGHRHQLEPDGDKTTHAVAPGADETVCGRSLEGLVSFDRPFFGLNLKLRCGVCDDELGNPHP